LTGPIDQAHRSGPSIRPIDQAHRSGPSEGHSVELVAVSAATYPRRIVLQSLGHVSRLSAWVRRGASISTLLVGAACASGDKVTDTSDGTGGGDVAPTSGPSTGPSTGSGDGGATGSGSANSGSANSSSGSGSTASSSATGSGGGPVVESGPASDALVCGGQTATSNGYRAVFTIGQSSPAQMTQTSPSYRFQGGLVGTTESLP
jgi:hypothetical protein